MQAAVHVPNTPVLKIVNDFEVPKPGKKQVLVKVQASGVCHTDVCIFLNINSNLADFFYNRFSF